MVDVRALIRDIPDFPEPGILFRDITPLLANAKAFSAVVDGIAGIARAHGVTCIAGVESRGFIVGAPVARTLGLPFIPIRKPGKLPFETKRIEYGLEYGTDALEVHVDAVKPGDRVAIIDDLMATGGTAEAAAKLMEDLGATVASILVVVELGGLGGVERLKPRPVHALIKY